MNINKQKRVNQVVDDYKNHKIRIMEVLKKFDELNVSIPDDEFEIFIRTRSLTVLIDKG
jgi:hypothetical protein